MKHAVEMRRLGGFDSPLAQNLLVEQRIERIGETVAVISLSESDMSPEDALQLDALEGLLEQNYFAERSKITHVGRHPQNSSSTAHC